jgi:2-polyprenyl-3-methyl-5-hydroxy-6-metoxy-1,4-benzoquinol methylase
MAPPTRWATEPPENHSQWLIDRFRRLAAEGADLGGEARFVDAVIAPAASVLDAGCGTGRVGALLHAAGHPVVGVDADKLLIAAARSEYPSIEWIVDDLSELNLREPKRGAASLRQCHPRGQRHAFRRAGHRGFSTAGGR